MAGANVNLFCRRFLVFALLMVGVSSADRVTEKIYQKIDNGFGCFRRLNGTHQIGCSCKFFFWGGGPVIYFLSYRHVFIGGFWIIA